jgi:hypothetical protein
MTRSDHIKWVWTTALLAVMSVNASAMEIYGVQSIVPARTAFLVDVALRAGGGHRGGGHHHGGGHYGGGYRGTAGHGMVGNRPTHPINRPGVAHPSHPVSGRWRRPAYGWRPGGAIAAGAAIGFLGAAAVTWATAPYPGLCWYYTDQTRRNGFWDDCP